MNESDDVLMVAISQQCQQSFAELYRRYAAFVKHIAQEVVHDSAEADDLLHEVFMEVWHGAHKFSPQKGKPVSWLATIARRRAIDRLRKREAYCRTKDRFQARTLHRQQQEDRSASDSIHEAVLRDLRNYLHKCLRELPAQQREVIEMAFFGQCSQREIARKTRIPVGTVKTRFELGLRKLARSVVPVASRV